MSTRSTERIRWPFGAIRTDVCLDGTHGLRDGESALFFSFETIPHLRARGLWRWHADTVLVGLLPGLLRRCGCNIRAKRPSAVARGDPPAHTHFRRRAE